MSYAPMPRAGSCAIAWLQAARMLYADGPTNNMILHIEDPVARSEKEDAILAQVDGFLRVHGAYPLSTVANTIFPDALYTPGKPELLYERYDRSFRKIKAKAPDWGRYFDRMINWQGSDGENHRQLQTLIDNLNTYGPQTDRLQPYYNMYELTLFHPEKDARKPLGRQCLSFIEVKPEVRESGVVLHLTALYRSHYYVARTLGNLVGLGRLLRFIAMETGCQVGTLTVHSTHAEIDRGVTNAKKMLHRMGPQKSRRSPDALRSDPGCYAAASRSRRP